MFLFDNKAQVQLHTEMKFREMIGLGKCKNHAELQILRITKDETTVSSTAYTVENWVNPFPGKQEMISLSTATTVSLDAAANLLRAHEDDRKAYQQIREGRLETDPSKTKFHDTLEKLKLTPFSDASKKKMKITITAKGKYLSLQTDRRLFSQTDILFSLCHGHLPHLMFR